MGITTSLKVMFWKTGRSYQSAGARAPKGMGSKTVGIAGLKL